MASAVDEALIETFRRIYTSIQHGDSDELTSSLAHDIEFVLPESLPWGGPHHGPLGVAAMVEIYWDHVDGSWADPDEFLEDGDRVVVLGRLTGKVRSSGQRFEGSLRARLGPVGRRSLPPPRLLRLRPDHGRPGGHRKLRSGGALLFARQPSV